MAQSVRGGEIIMGGASMAGAAVVLGEFDDAALDVGIYRIQVRCTIEDITQTVAEWTHTVSASL